jgi:hypothetical protein
MKIEPTILLRKIRLYHAVCPVKRAILRIWFHFRASAVCIIDTIGDRLPEVIL